MRGLTRRRAAVTGAVVLVVAGFGLWNQRRVLAEGAIGNELARRGIRATYRVADIGLRWERLENVVIGDPRAPDLTADWAEVRVAATLNGLTATTIRAGGVRLRGRLVDGKVSFGTIDKLIPAPSGGPFSLPDLTVDLTDARIALATSYGNVGARLDGRGNLSDGFHGKLAAIAPTLEVAGCRAGRATLYADIVISDRRPVLKGPVRANDLACGATRLRQVSLGMDVALSEALDRWQGRTALGVTSLTSGSQRLDGASGQIEFAGDARQTKGSGRVGVTSALNPLGAMNGLSLIGKFAVKGGDLDGQGIVKAARMMVDQRYVTRLRSISAKGTPAGPLLDKLFSATATASRFLTISADVAVQVRAAGSSAIMTSADVTTPQGMRLRIGGGRGIGFGTRGLLVDTKATLAGGGFPTVAATFRRAGTGVTNGVARVEAYTADNARLALTPVQFAIGQSGSLQVRMSATLDGPIGDGHLGGLQMPLALSVDGDGMALNTGCTLATFHSLTVSGLQLDPASFRLCATGDALLKVEGGKVGGGAMVRSAQITGRMGRSPLTIAAMQSTFALSDRRFAIDNLSVKMGDARQPTTLGFGTLVGSYAGGAIIGKFGAVSGKIANVPLLVDASTGDWSLRAGVLALTGSARVSDEASPVRFNPLSAQDIKLRLANGKVMMTGMLREPKTGTTVSDVAIAHDLGSGTGHAALDVASIDFGPALQPEALTPLTLGVVANVQGKISGKGRIDWTTAAVTSRGKFATKGLDLAAAFGPVSGVTGEIVFTDLLGLVTAPGQHLSIATVNPGIPVPDGSLTYHLAANQKIVVEGGRWPFAGGVLILDPTTLDMGVSRERRLTFRVEGLDAAKFIQQLEFENLSATGIFDGAMPMIFDDQGGRIVGGKIVARPGGGTLSYVGDVSNADMNVFGKLAFDALKSIRYNNLVIEMDGALDGEIISKVNFRGVNEAPTNVKRGYFARQFSNLPFIFNITVRAPFRGLLATARTFQDPSSLLSGLPLQDPASVIQPPESEKRP